MSWFRRDRQFVAAFCPSACQYFTTISRSHSLHKTVLVPSFPFRWLKRSFAHGLIFLKLGFDFGGWKTGCKYKKDFFLYKGKSFFLELIRLFAVVLAALRAAAAIRARGKCRGGGGICFLAGASRIFFVWGRKWLLMLYHGSE